MTKLPEENIHLIKRILSDGYCQINIRTISIVDNLENICHTCLTFSSDETVEAEGVGMVDAIFIALKEKYSIEFKSISDLELHSFYVNTKGSSSKSEVVVELVVKNSNGMFISFKDSSKSLVASSTRVCVEAVEYFVNSEKAFLVIHRALGDARTRGREDLITRYESELSSLTEINGYSVSLAK